MFEYALVLGLISLIVIALLRFVGAVTSHVFCEVDQGLQGTCQVYVTNYLGNTITRIDLASNTDTTIPIGAGSGPTSIVITPDGNTAYVSDYTSGKVQPINLNTDALGTPITVGTNPWGLTISPDGATAYVANNYHGFPNGTVSVIDLSSNTVTATIPVGFQPVNIGVTKTTAYVVNQDDGTVSVIDRSTNTVTGTITVGTLPWGIAITGSTAYVPNEGDATHPGNVLVIDLTTNTVIGSITAGTNPGGICINPSGTTAYVSNLGGNTVSVINLATRTVTHTIAVGTEPWGVTTIRDGSAVYVANNNNNGAGSVSVINPNTNAVTSTVTAGTAAIGIAAH